MKETDECYLKLKRHAKYDTINGEYILRDLFDAFEKRLDKNKLYAALEKIKDTIKQAEADSNRMDSVEKEKFKIYCSAHIDAITSLKNLIEGI